MYNEIGISQINLWVKKYRDFNTKQDAYYSRKRKHVKLQIKQHKYYFLSFFLCRWLNYLSISDNLRNNICKFNSMYVCRYALLDTRMPVILAFYFHVYRSRNSCTKFSFHKRHNRAPAHLFVRHERYIMYHVFSLRDSK